MQDTNTDMKPTDQTSNHLGQTPNMSKRTNWINHGSAHAIAEPARANIEQIKANSEPTENANKTSPTPMGPCLMWLLLAEVIEPAHDKSYPILNSIQINP